MRPRSKKMARLYRQRSKFVREQLAVRVACEAYRRVEDKNPWICTRLATALHEPLTRARGGDILDPENTVAVCFNCHDFIHRNPAWALEVGLLRRAVKEQAQ
jgi:hypothetical protein